ncbi:MAG: transcriptional regulator [Gammaproteobacteria bacterium]
MLEQIFASPKTMAQATGNSLAGFYALIAAGLLPPLIKQGRKKSLAVVAEHQAVAAARAAGKNSEEIRALVKSLVAARPKVLEARLSEYIGPGEAA